MAEKVDLIATKAMTYSTRRLQADDLFQANRRDARLLVAIGKARLKNDAEQALVKPTPKATLKPSRKPKAR